MKRSSVAVIDAHAAQPAAPQQPPSSEDLGGLRRRLAGATAREAVLVDFLEDDLREAEEALAEVSGWLDAVASAVRSQRVTRQELAALAARSRGAEDLEYLGGVLASVRRRLALVSVGLARAGE